MTGPHPQAPEAKPMPISPTPWTNNGGRIEAADGTVVCTVGTVNEQTSQDTGNAQLIAAAPALMEALGAAARSPGSLLLARKAIDLAKEGPNA